MRTWIWLMGAVLPLQNVADNHPFCIRSFILFKKLTFGFLRIRSKFFENITLSIKTRVLHAVNNHVHSKTFSSYLACSNQIATKRSILWQVSGKVHFLPLPLFSQSITSRKSKFTQMPPFNKVDLPVSRIVINLLRMRFVVN